MHDEIKMREVNKQLNTIFFNFKKEKLQIK